MLTHRVHLKGSSSVAGTVLRGTFDRRLCIVKASCEHLQSEANNLNQIRDMVLEANPNTNVALERWLPQVLMHHNQADTEFLILSLPGVYNLDQMPELVRTVTNIGSAIDQVSEQLVLLHAVGWLHGNINPANIAVAWGCDGKLRSWLINFEHAITKGQRRSSPPTRSLQRYQVAHPAEDRQSLYFSAFEMLLRTRQSWTNAPEQQSLALTLPGHWRESFIEPRCEAVRILTKVRCGIGNNTISSFCAC